MSYEEDLGIVGHFPHGAPQDVARHYRGHAHREGSVLLEHEGAPEIAGEHVHEQPVVTFGAPKRP